MLKSAVDRINGIFNNPTLRRILLKLRYPIFVLCFILLISQIKPSLFLLGFIVSLFGALIQFWSFASLNKNKTLAANGPYVMTRNPMYIGRYFLLLGFLVLVGNLPLLIVFTVLYYFYMLNRVKREEKKLRSVFGEAYEAYCRRVNRFLPSFRAFDWKAFLFFKPKLLIGNHGHWNFLLFLFCYGIFYVFTF